MSRFRGRASCARNDRENPTAVCKEIANQTIFSPGSVQITHPAFIQLAIVRASGLHAEKSRLEGFDLEDLGTMRYAVRSAFGLANGTGQIQRE